MYTTKLNYLRRLVPTFCRIYLNCMIQSINKSCLGLLRKLIAYASREQLDRVVQMNVIDSSSVVMMMMMTAANNNTENTTYETTSISTMLIELISKILQEEANLESVYTGLSISSDLFRKCSPLILEEFTRLGVANQISQLAAQTQQPTTNESESIIQVDRMYVWENEWCLLCVKDFVYAWNPYCAVELSHTSNGWFRFLVNNKLYSMYSNGKPETTQQEEEEEEEELVDENKLMFVNRLLRAKQTFTNCPNEQLFTDTTDQRVIGNWTLRRVGERGDEMEIRNMSAAAQRILFRVGLHGIEFDGAANSSSSRRQSFVGLVNQGNGFSLPPPTTTTTTTTDRPPPPKPSSSNVSKLSALQHYFSEAALKTSRTRQKDLKESVAKLAAKLADDYLKSCQLKPRPLALQLINLVADMRHAAAHDNMSAFEKSLDDLKCKPIHFCC